MIPLETDVLRKHRFQKIDFNLLISDIPIYVSSKFEIFIFDIALVIKHHGQFMFRFVQTVYAS